MKRFNYIRKIISAKSTFFEGYFFIYLKGDQFSRLR